MSKKIKKFCLLVAVDFTSFSEEALLFASEIGKCMGLQLIVLHVIHDPAEAPGFYSQKGKKKKKYLINMEDAATDMMEEFLKKMRESYPDNAPIKDAIPQLVIGTPVTRIIEMAKRENAKMIIMGSNGRTGLSHLMIGSKAERVVQLSPIPVTVVKTSVKS